jgi:hypothetical protein
LCALAQTSPPEPPAKTDGAAAPAAEPAANPPAAPAEPAPETCRSLTDKGMAADLKALSAKAQKMEVEALLQLHGTSETFWTEAVERCEGRAKERAQRNLAESQKAAAALKEQMSDGPECSAAHKDAAMLQDLARVALGERRWIDAATMFHKSEDMWDLAAERCSGSQRALALKRQEQSELDGYNAEFCAPLFDRAREQTQKLRASAAGLSREEKQDGLMVAETLWRDALAQCKGPAAQDSARNNAQTLARERGTPWVARNPAPAVAAAQPVKASALPSKAAAAEPASNKAKAVAALPDLDSKASSTAAAASLAGAGTASAASSSIGSTLTGAFAAAAAALQQVVPVLGTATPEVQPENFAVGDMRFEGKFVRDVDTPTYSGSGKLSWANGDVFDGTLVNGKRHGKGYFVWGNGQRYRGDWVNDVPTGQAVVDFANGDHYEGKVENASPTGAGSMRYASGDTYKGLFAAGEPHGTGLYTWKNGQKYDGDWRNGKPNGQGKMQFANGDRYEGTLRDGVPNQTGTFTWVSGDSYAGQWKAGRKNGQGTFTWTTGDRWEGIFENDQQSATGTLIRKTP